MTLSLLAASPALAQGLSDRLSEAEKKLDADIKACKPIDPAEYKPLVSEANSNIKAAKAAAQSGAGGFVDTSKLNSDLQKASGLYKRAVEAAANKPCPPPQQQPQQPKQAPAPPQLAPVQPGQVGGGPVVDPWTALKFEAWELFEDLDEAIWYCDIDEVKRLIPELEDLLKRAKQVAATAKAAGKFSKIDPQKAQDLVDSIQDALDDAKSVKACPLLPKESTTTPKPPTGKSEPGKPKPGGTGKSEKSSLNDLFKPEEKATPPKVSIVEDLVEPPTPGELKILDDALRELGKSGKAMQGAPGCDPKTWEAHVRRLELIAKRTRQMADWAKTPGQTTGVDPKEAERVANEAQKQLDEAKKSAPADCPKTSPPPNGSQSLRIPEPNVHLSAFAESVLTIHNAERSAVGAPPLRWSFKLQQDATQWADQMARTGQLIHAPREGRGVERENLGQGRIGWSAEQIVRNEWVGEKRFFHAGIYPNVCISGDWQQCSHYSQMIWPTTTDLGCGYAVGSGYSWLVCRYSPGGNKDNYPVGYYDPWSRGMSRLPPPPPPAPPPAPPPPPP